MRTIEIETSHGKARASVHDAPSPRAALVLGHGAGGGMEGKGWLGAKDVALSLGVGVALVEQPYRAVGRRSPPPAPHLDTGWLEVVAALRRRWFHDLRSLSAAGRQGRVSP